MTEQQHAPVETTRSRAVPAFVLIALAAMAATGFLYVSAGQSGKKGENAACAQTQQTAARIAALAKGEVAAMTIAKDPQPMPDIVFNGPDGQPRTLADFKGKTVLLNLWATWCVPCRQEMPALDRLQKQTGSDTFEVVAVNVDTARLDRPKAFLDEIGVKSLAYYADPKADVLVELKQSGKLVGLPTTLLIDPSGCQIGLMTGPAAWDSADGQALVASVAGTTP
ncbi:MAG: TlpA family protein disulfide reductase [Methylocystis sp.]|nr:TlpA family protein disulfide reductase [Methylocystis sp.]